MLPNDALTLFLERIPSEYPKHMLCYFAGNAARGVVLPFVNGLCRALAEIDSATPGYANEMMNRLAAIKDKGEAQYEAILQILAEIYVTQGVVEAASHTGVGPQVAHEPGPSGKKNPECEALIAGHWCAIEVKTPKLIEYGRLRASKPWQLTARMQGEATKALQATLPRDNPVKDFLVSAEAKFAIYESHRPNALRLLVIIWDDFCNEPIAALVNPMSGLLTQNSFHRDANNLAVTYPHVDGVVVIRHHHQLIRATRCEPLVDGVKDALRYRHDGFPPKAFIAVAGGRIVPNAVLDALNLVPLSACMGAEYQPTDFVMWFGG
jgi:hypothetical protein